MGVGDGDGEGVGGVGAGDLHAGQKALDHGMDLRLLGAAGPDHRLLDQPRRIFAHGDSEAGGGEEDDSARLAELQGRLGIVVDEHLLDRGRAWEMLDEDREEPAVKLKQAGRKRGLRVGPDLAVGDMGQAIALGRDHAPAGAAEAWVEAKDDQESRSITSSDTS